MTYFYIHVIDTKCASGKHKRGFLSFRMCFCLFILDDDCRALLLLLFYVHSRIFMHIRIMNSEVGRSSLIKNIVYTICFIVDLSWKFEDENLLLLIAYFFGMIVFLGDYLKYIDSESC